MFCYSACAIINNMSDNKTGKEKGIVPYRVVFVVLILAIVGLIIGIVMVGVSRGNDKSDEPVEDDSVLETRVMEKVSAMREDSNIGVEEIEEYYDSVINDANNDGNYSLAARIIVQRTLFLVINENDCEGANEYYKGLDTSFYSDDELLYLTTNVDSILSECEVEEEAD